MSSDHGWYAFTLNLPVLYIKGFFAELVDAFCNFLSPEVSYTSPVCAGFKICV